MLWRMKTFFFRGRFCYSYVASSISHFLDLFVDNRIPFIAPCEIKRALEYMKAVQPQLVSAERRVRGDNEVIRRRARAQVTRSTGRAVH